MCGGVCRSGCKVGGGWCVNACCDVVAGAVFGGGGDNRGGARIGACRCGVGCM